MKSPLRVLLIEDSENDAQLVLRQLQRANYAPEPRRVQTAEELRAALRTARWDLILSDHSMPEFSAPDALGIVRQHGDDIPFIVVSGSIGEEQAVAVMKAGAHDYVMKDNLTRLASVVERELREAEGRCNRRKAEMALRESEAMFRALSSSSPLGIFMADASGSITYVNPRYRNILRLGLMETIGDGWLQRLFPEDRAQAHADWKNFVQEDGDYNVEHRLHFPDGQTRWVRSRASAIRDENAVIIGYVGTVEDNTEYKIAELALHESEEYNRRLVEEARDVIFSLAPDGKIAALNPAFETLTGWQQSEWIGRHFLPLISPDDVPFALDRFQTVLKGEIPPPFELRVLTKSNQFLIVEFTATPRVRDRVVQGISGIARDVTQRKMLEAQLRVSQKFEAIGQLAGGVAHDFNNVLSVIIGYSDFLLTRLAVTDPNRESAEQILKAAERAARLTNQLLAFSRKQTLQPEILNLNAHITSLEPLLRRLIGEDIELTFLPAAILSSVKADPSQIEQVFINLIVNARDAMPNGGTIVIQTSNVTLTDQSAARHSDLKPGDYVKVSVTDTGCGMSPEVQMRIYEPFFTTKPEGKGTGLGLPTCYGIVKQNGGGITLESAIGCGTTFNIFLPAIAAQVAAPAAKTDAPAPTPRGAETILIVEDEEALRELAQLVLSELGYNVLVATNGVEALRLTQQHKDSLSLVVSDVVMPQMSGRELAEKLRVLLPNLQLLFVSGYTDDAVIRRGVSRANFPFLQKPFTPTSLARKVREVLDRK